MTKFARPPALPEPAGSEIRTRRVHPARVRSHCAENWTGSARPRIFRKVAAFSLALATPLVGTTTAFASDHPLSIEARLTADPEHAATIGLRPVNPTVDSFDDAYFMVPHNTYALGDSLTQWLNDGIRAVELDVIDKGDWEHEDGGPFVAHSTNEGRTNCPGDPTRLKDCLTAITQWIDAHPTQGPILLFVDMKTDWDPGNAWDPEEITLLDQKVFDILGRYMFTAADLYQAATGRPFPQHDATLREVVATHGWPLLEQMQSKIVVAYTGGHVGRINQRQGEAIDRLLNAGQLPRGFLCPNVEGDPKELYPGSTIDGMTQQASGTTICSNTKTADHYEVVSNASSALNQIQHLWDQLKFPADSYPFNYLAIAHGASAINREQFAADTFGQNLPLVGIRRSVPGYFEIRPTSDPGKCLDVEGGRASNGTRLIVWECNGQQNQRFVYTAEGQLRPELNNRYCVDIVGKGWDLERDDGDEVHTWDCDGGNSEKWELSPNGTFRSFEEPTFCLDQSGGPTPRPGSSVVVAHCGSGTQDFTLVPVPEWTPSEY